mmetsp:Transcript_4158/g.12502  ORF Transcript_4158/g.12502 Transcript_4158/m.12502 type:complete len:423 (+) Transcript_4158:486-1754(+)
MLATTPKKTVFDGTTCRIQLEALEDINYLEKAALPNWDKKNLGMKTEATVGLMRLYERSQGCWQYATAIINKLDELGSLETDGELMTSYFKVLLSSDKTLLLQTRYKAIDERNETLSADAYLTVMRAYNATGSNVSLIEEVLMRARAKGVQLHTECYNFVLMQYGDSHEKASRVFELMVEGGVAPDGESFALLKNAYENCGMRGDLESFLDEMSTDRTGPIFRDLSHLYLDSPNPEPQLVKSVLLAHLGPSHEQTYNRLFREFGRFLKEDADLYTVEFEANLSHGRIDRAADCLKSIPNPSADTFFRLIIEYFSRRQIDRVMLIYHEVEVRGLKKTVNIYNAVIGSLMLADKCEEAMNLARELLTDSVPPNDYSVKLVQMIARTTRSPAHTDVLMRLRYKLDDHKKSLQKDSRRSEEFAVLT